MKKKWLDEDVVEWANIYISSPDMTLERMEKEIGVSHSTTWWCFTRRLRDINISLYNKVMLKIRQNVHARKRGRK